MRRLAHPRGSAASGRGAAALGPAPQRRRGRVRGDTRSTSPNRIRRVYGREAEVIYSPVDVARFRIAEALDDYYLVVSALVPYKRVDLAVAAATRLGRRLLVVGTGPEEARLRALAGPTVTFLGWRPDAEVAELYARCRAVLFPSVEDFGIVPLEAAAAGRPTHRAGARRSAGDDDRSRRRRRTADGGLLRRADGGVALAGAMTAFETAADRFEPRALRARAAQFDRPIFAERVREYVERRWSRFQARARVLKAHSRLFEHLALVDRPRADRRVLDRRLRRCASTCSARATFHAVLRLHAAAGADPHRVGHRLQGLRPLPAQPARLAPVRVVRHRQGVHARRARPHRRHDVPVPRLRVLAARHSSCSG